MTAFFGTMATIWHYYNENKEKIEVTSTQLKALAKQGVVKPETYIIDPTGRTGRAKDVKGLKFVPMSIEDFSVEDIENFAADVLENTPMPIPNKIPEPAFVPLPQNEVPQPKYETPERHTGLPKHEDMMPNRVLILCLVSLIPGLGHFLLGCGSTRSAWICFKTLLLMFIGECLFLLLCGVPCNIAAAIDVSLVPEVLLIVVPLWLFGNTFILFGAYEYVIRDLKKEYQKRYST